MNYNVFIIILKKYFNIILDNIYLHLYISKIFDMDTQTRRRSNLLYKYPRIEEWDSLLLGQFSTAPTLDPTTGQQCSQRHWKSHQLATNGAHSWGAHWRGTSISNRWPRFKLLPSLYYNLQVKEKFKKIIKIKNLIQHLLYYLFILLTKLHIKII